MQTLVTALAERALTNPKTAAVVTQNTTIDSAGFDALTTAGGNALHDAGVGPGDRVLLHLANGRELALAYYSCFKAGATAVPVPKGASAVEIRRIVEACRPRIGLTRVAVPSVHFPSMPWLIVDENWPPAGDRNKLPAVDAKDIALILYTSGTTGPARGVAHTQHSLSGLFNAYRQAPSTGITTVIALPIVHGYGFFTFASVISTGGTVVLLDDDFNPEHMLDAIDRHSATMAIANPAMAHALAETQARSPRRLAALSHINVSGDIVPLELQKRFNQVFGNRLRRTYGSSELGPIAGEPAGTVAANSLGLPFHGVEIRILDDNGRDVPVRHIGEIAVRSPSMASCYWGDNAATAAVFRNGYLHTGDLGFRDETMRLHFACRKKELIVRAGLNISPIQIEEILRQHPAVAEVAVWGIPDPVFGQSVAAWVVTKAPVSAEQLREFVRPQVAVPKCPEQIFFVKALPKTAAGKLLRRILVPPTDAL